MANWGIRVCTVCKKDYTPYDVRQVTCRNPECMKERRIDLARKFRKKNPKRMKEWYKQKDDRANEYFYKNWKTMTPSSRYDLTSGYVELSFSPFGFKIAEHRWVMMNHLGRTLMRWEHIHHKNGIRNDNSIDNLQLLPASDHSSVTQLINENKILRAKVKELEESMKTYEVENR